MSAFVDKVCFYVIAMVALIARSPPVHNQFSGVNQ